MTNSKTDAKKLKSKAFTALSKEEEIHRLNAPPQSKQMTLASRVALFFIFPTFVGGCGLMFAYLQIKFPDESEKKTRKINFDRDFIYPFLMSLALVVVIAIQTGGFSSYTAAPLVSWPKVIKQVTVVRKKVYLDDDGNEVDEAVVLKALEKRKGGCKSD